jgi:hypothetical protein
LCAVASCGASYGDCDGDATNGCETDMSSSSAHFGSCGIACASGAACPFGVCGGGTLGAPFHLRWALAVDRERPEVWVVDSTGYNDVYRMRSDGWERTLVADFPAAGMGYAGLALTPDAVYVSSDDVGTIEQIDRATFATTRLTTTPAVLGGLQVVGDELWGAAWGNGTIWAYPLGGGSWRVALGPLGTRTFHFCVEGDQAYHSTATSGGVLAGYVGVVPSSGGTSTVLVNRLIYPGQLALDTRHL